MQIYMEQEEFATAAGFTFNEFGLRINGI
jgi:hypothetical protein